MPPSVHKVLIHGPSVVQKCILPIGRFSEEVLESSHKICKLYRKSFSRKSSRTNTNEDIFKRLLLNSDPLISMSSSAKCAQNKKMPQEVLDLLTEVDDLETVENSVSGSDLSETSDSE